MLWRLFRVRVHWLCFSAVEFNADNARRPGYCNGIRRLNRPEPADELLTTAKFLLILISTCVLSILMDKYKTFRDAYVSKYRL
jgi:hypothetical protein